MTHYVCTGGCNWVSDLPATCQSKDCIKYHLPMTVCHCENGLHQEAYENPNNTATEQGTQEI
jgi:hypothetical protein